MTDSLSMNLIRKAGSLVRQLLTSKEIHSVFPAADTVSQLQLKLNYRSLAKLGVPLLSFPEVGFKNFSQTDEDGILLYIFSIIGSTNQKCIEICAGDGIECNTANLIIHHGWTGLLIDGDKKNVLNGEQFYRTHPNTRIFPPRFLHAWITRENINQIIQVNGYEGDIDLLSIDIDGMDYWIWDAIEAVKPRVVVIEYQDILGPEKSLTVPYKADFNAYIYPTTAGMPNFCGASLPALVKLGRKKGYRLVGCNRYGYNAFFIKDSLEKEKLAEIKAADCFTHPKVVWGMKERFPTIKEYPWVEV